MFYSQNLSFHNQFLAAASQNSAAELLGVLSSSVILHVGGISLKHSGIYSASMLLKHSI
jgi:hypothetical protein